MTIQIVDVSKYEILIQHSIRNGAEKLGVVIIVNNSHPAGACSCNGRPQRVSITRHYHAYEACRRPDQSWCL
jgi:hypothetical protein